MLYSEHPLNHTVIMILLLVPLNTLHWQTLRTKKK